MLPTEATRFGGPELERKRECDPQHREASLFKSDAE